ncbi:MAG: hypothetical protein H7Y32_18165 [Chloroflexales bacterium]|nr:hypothetical protein [Chloroflexales bacterium]
MKRNSARGAIVDGAMLGLVVALGAAAIILYGAGRQPESAGSARAGAAERATNTPSVITRTPTSSPVATQEAAMPPERRDVPRADDNERTGRPAIIPAAVQHAVAQATADLAQRLGVGADQIEMLGVTRLYKPSGVTDGPGGPIGWSIRLGVGSDVYKYTVDVRGTLHRR